MPRKPSLVLAKPGSAFGFKPRTSESTTGVRASDHRAISGSTQPSEVALDSESGSEQAAWNEEHQNAAGMDLDPKEYSAHSEEYGMDPSTNVNEDVFGKPFPYSLPVLMLYPRTRD